MKWYVIYLRHFKCEVAAERISLLPLSNFIIESAPRFSQNGPAPGNAGSLSKGTQAMWIANLSIGKRLYAGFAAVVACFAMLFIFANIDFG